LPRNASIWENTPGVAFQDIVTSEKEKSISTMTGFWEHISVKIRPKADVNFANMCIMQLKGGGENPFEDVVHQSILGVQDFVEWVRQKLPRNGQREVPSLNKLQHDIPIELIIAEVAKAGNVKAADLIEKRNLRIWGGLPWS
jgi:hypothetical protein